MWLGANPRSKGLATEDLDGSDAFEDSDYQRSALQIACSSKKPEILKRLKPDPTVDDLRELMTAAASWSVTPETVAYLVRLGADINDKVDGGSTALDRCLNSFGWKEAVWDNWYTKSTVPMSRLGPSLDALQFLLDKGARWTPDNRSIADTRRALYRVEGEAIAVVVDLLRTHKSCDEATLSALVRAPKMRSLLAAVARRRENTERHAQPDRAGRTLGLK
jgi:ankyrin repeat protein